MRQSELEIVGEVLAEAEAFIEYGHGDKDALLGKINRAALSVRLDLDGKREAARNRMLKKKGLI